MSEWEWAPGSGKGSLIEAAGAGFCWEGRHPKADPSHHFVGMPRAYRGRGRMSGLAEGGSPSRPLCASARLRRPEPEQPGQPQRCQCQRRDHERGLHGPVMPPNPSNDLKRQRRQRRRHDHEHALGAPVMPPTPSDDLAKLASCRPNDGRPALRPLRTVAPSPSIGAGRSALRHPGRDRSLGYAHAGTVA
jgi:hypothetical protein